jgi:hypothetical protein
MERRNWGAAKDHLNKAIEVASDSVDLLLMRAEGAEKEPSKRALKTSLTTEPYKWGPTTEPC